MKWRKLGVVWKPDGSLWWARTHATCPTPVRLNDEVLRVYVQCRDECNIGRVGYVDLASDNPLEVLGWSAEPVLDIGPPGTFDDNGVLQTALVSSGDVLFMYYAGFELCRKIRYRLLAGLAISNDGGESFQRIKNTPILERSNDELFFRGGPFVLKEHGCFRMWYVAGSKWIDLDGKSMPVYNMRYLESADGVNWGAHGKVILELSNDDEHGFGRPYIVREDGYFRLFYSVRKKSLRQYRMGYAESGDGIVWQRHDEKIGITVSEAGWDSDAVEYGAMSKISGKTYLFYNGNDFGGTGFGVAALERD